MTQITYGPTSKIEQQAPASSAFAVHAVASEQGRSIASVSGAWTSDSGATAIGAMAIAVHDSSQPYRAAWPLYLEGWFKPNAHPSGSVFPEIAIINQSDVCGEVNPYYMSGPGQTNGLRVGVGKPGSGGKEISALGTFLNVEGTTRAKAKKGLVFGFDVLDMLGGIGRVLCMAKDHALVWFDQWGRETSNIVCRTTAAEHRVSIELGNNSVHFMDSKGASQLSLDLATGTLYLGAGSVGPNGTIRIAVAGRKYLVKATPE